MLSNDTISPRPRPPAQARRASVQVSSSSGSPIPFPWSRETPVTPPADQVSPVTLSRASSKRTSLLASQEGANVDWTRHKSREELSQLLTKADEMIREREIDLTTTTALTKSLYEANTSLKSKHEAFLSRIPVTPAQSVMEFPVSPAVSSHNLPGPETPYASSQQLPRRTRRISLYPSDIALLTDQNAELLAKVEKLESESSQADQSGRRLLKKLEREIQELREELEKTQVRSEELEERTRANLKASAEREAERAEREREERLGEVNLRDLRSKARSPDYDDEDSPVMDFAPGSSVTSSTWPNRAYSPMFSPDRGRPRSPTASSVSSNQPENAVISQLLMKMMELEETNERIQAQQLETTANLQAVQRDAENFSKLYESIGDPSNVEWQVVAEGEEDDQVEGGGGLQQPSVTAAGAETIRFRSLRRTLEGDMLKKPKTGDEDVFGGRGQNTHTRAGNKARKSVVGLFDAPAPSSSSANYFSKPSVPLTSSFHFPADHAATHSWASNLLSPTLSVLGLSTPPRTLQSELGSECGDDWGSGSHLRSSSLYDGLSQVSVSNPTSPLPFPAHLPVDARFAEREPSTPFGGLQTPQSLEKSVLQLTTMEESPTPVRPRAQQRMDTIRSRTTRWTENRFQDSLKPNNPEAPGNKLASVLEAVIVAVRGKAASEEATSPRPKEEELKGNEIQLHQSSEVAPPATTKEGHGAVAFVLEVWLWLQFAIIIFLFLWAMARRGPKVVLNDVDRKRSSVTPKH